MYNNLNMNGAGRAHDYASALKLWATAGTWRGKPDNERVLTVRRHAHKRIVKNADDSISFQLYSTSVVTYMSGGDIVIDPYPTTMTSSFANYFLPNEFYPAFNAHTLMIRPRDRFSPWKYSRYYRAFDSLRLTPSDGEYPWEVIRPKPWTRQVPDPERARKAREEYGYPHFAAVGQMFFALQGHHGCTFIKPDNSLDLMKAGGAAWLKFVTTPRQQGYARVFDGGPPYTWGTLLTKMRDTIYRCENAYNAVSFPFVTSNAMWQAVRR